jgi:hypothetical protein
MRAYTPLLVLVFLLLSSAPAVQADLIFNNGVTNTVTSPINDQVQISNNTVVIFNAGGNVTAFSSLGGFLTASLAAVSVFDTSRVIDNAANLTGSMSTGGCNVNSASGLSAADTAVVSIGGGNLTGFISSGGGFGCSASNTASGLSARGGSMVSVSGGTFTGSISSGGFIDNFATGLSAWDDARVSVSGGTFMGIVSSGGGGVLRAQGLSAAGNSLVLVSGGSFTASGASSNLGLLVMDNAQVTLFGNDFNLPFGPISPLEGTITGTLKSGEGIDFSFSQSRPGQIILSLPDTEELTALSPATLWIGLKNSDAVGLRLDLQAEVFLNETKVGEGALNNVASGSSGFNNAKLNAIPLTLFAPVEVPADAELAMTLSVRRTCFGGGHNSGTPRLWYNGQPIDSGSQRDAGTRVGATIADTTSEFFLRDGFVLSTTAGTARTFVDVPVDNKTPCPNRPFTPFGTWSLRLP